MGKGVALSMPKLDSWQWLALLQHELLLFAGVFFLIGALDDLAINGLWLLHRASGRGLILTDDDPTDQKCKLVRLTSEGYEGMIR